MTRILNRSCALWASLAAAGLVFGGTCLAWAQNQNQNQPRGNQPRANQPRANQPQNNHADDAVQDDGVQNDQQQGNQPRANQPRGTQRGQANQNPRNANQRNQRQVDQRRNQPNQANQVNQRRGGALNRRGAAGPNVRSRGAVDFLQTSNFIGSPLLLQEGNEFGTINDFIIGPNGCLQFLIVGDGDTFLPIPWQALQFDPDQGLLMNVDADFFARAPQFENIDDLNNAAFLRRLNTFYRVSDRPGVGVDRGSAPIPRRVPLDSTPERDTSNDERIAPPVREETRGPVTAPANERSQRPPHTSPSTPGRRAQPAPAVPGSPGPAAPAGSPR